MRGAHVAQHIADPGGAGRNLDGERLAGPHQINAEGLAAADRNDLRQLFEVVDRRCRQSR